MLTPKQSRLLKSLDPEVLAILDLVPVPSKEFKTNQAIEHRVNTWIEEASNSTYKPRSVKAGPNHRLPWIVDPEPCSEVLRPLKGWMCMSGKNILSPF